jgi:hypothetical protein
MSLQHRIKPPLVLAVVITVASVALDQPSAQGQDKPTVKATAAQLMQEFKKSKKATNKKYEAATLEVDGTVLRTGKSPAGQPVVELRGTDDLIGLRCYTKEQQPWGKFAPGQKVKVVGKWTDIGLSAELTGCSVEAVDKSPARAVAAEQFAKECAADPRGANKKLSKATFLVTGTVAGTKYVEASGFTQLHLKGVGPAVVICNLLPSEKELASKLKAGDAASAVGQFSYTDGKEVFLDTCLMLTK